MKSPTSVALLPTLALDPLVLIRTWSRSGKRGLLTVRVQKVRTIPLRRPMVGVSNQLLMVEVPVPLVKFAPI